MASQRNLRTRESLIDGYLNRHRSSSSSFDKYNAKHDTEIAAHGLGEPSIFIDNKGTENEQRYLTFAFSGTGRTKDGEPIGHAHGIIRLDPISD